MRVLWFSTTPGLYGKGNNAYNGGGWIASLQGLLENEQIDLGLSFITHTKLEKKVEGHTIYYPVFVPELTMFQKLRFYYGGYRKEDKSVLESVLQRVVEDFQPDIIHVFGLENPQAIILGKTDMPVIVHLQGILGPYDNAFWPPAVNSSSFIWPFSKQEWILRNGYNFAKKSIHVRAYREKKLFKKLEYAMGRTTWDKQCTSLMAPQSEYFHVDEVLRPVFYEHQGRWGRPGTDNIQIISTISSTVYKGLDLILKTAKLLKEYMNISFNWYVAGVTPDDYLVKFFEKIFNIRSEEVNIRYLGVLTAKDLCQQELQSHCYVHTSYVDNSPNSLCEAQLLGVPCISTNVGGISSLVEHGKTGFLVPANAPYELAYYISQIARDKELATVVSKKGILSAAKRHDKEKIANQLLNTYKKIINE